MSLKPQNILCQRISESEVVPVVCDNLGESTFIPLATWSTWCCERKLERVWQRFIAQPALAVALERTSSQKTRNGWRLLLTKLNGLCLSGLDDTDRRPDKAFAPPIGKIN